MFCFEALVANSISLLSLLIIYSSLQISCPVPLPTFILCYGVFYLLFRSLAVSRIAEYASPLSLIDTYDKASFLSLAVSSNFWSVIYCVSPMIIY